MACIWIKIPKHMASMNKVEYIGVGFCVLNDYYSFIMYKKKKKRVFDQFKFCMVSISQYEYEDFKA